MSSEEALRARIAEAKDEGTSGKPVQPLKVNRIPKFKLTVSELKQVSKQNLDHPNAKVFLQAVRGFADDKEITVDRVDIEALLDDRNVIMETRIQPVSGEASDIKVVEKKLGPPRTVKAEPKPKTSTKKKE